MAVIKGGGSTVEVRVVADSIFLSVRLPPDRPTHQYGRVDCFCSQLDKDGVRELIKELQHAIGES